ncbi:MAG: UDP-2,3-diacylglucosamine diphosphatase [bacterium]|nr:UDP-2,3-diacylglucosamine diphosphatase [bacterium]
MSRNSVYFLSDAHFYKSKTIEERKKRQAFREFLEMASDAEHLYIAGDLFDFWFEYRRVAPTGFVDVLYPLRELCLKGTPVTILGGNHDYWLGRHLEEEIGLILAPDGLVAEHQGRRLLIDHGDEVLSNDRKYLMLKSVIRNRVFIAAAKYLLHPDFTMWAADKLADGSRYFEQRDKEEGRPCRSLRLTRLLDNTFDILILGHLHLSFHYKYRNWEILCLGDWITAFNHAKLENGVISLHDRQGGTIVPEAIENPDITPRSGKVEYDSIGED